MARAATLPVLNGESGLAHYLTEIRKFPMLEPQQEYMLAKRWREHDDRDAAHQLVTSHLRLVAKIAMGYRGYGLPISEVVSEGNVGLMQAVKRFEPEKGFRLATYAMWWIKASIQEYILRSWSLVKMGTTANQKKLFFNLRKAKSKISALEEGDLRPDQVKQIATSRRHRAGRCRHEPPPRRRCVAQRSDPRRRRTRRMAGLAGRYLAQPGSHHGGERGVRSSPQRPERRDGRAQQPSAAFSRRGVWRKSR
jgi:RNA polymerase sigma factor (sigma-70 family)